MIRSEKLELDQSPLSGLLGIILVLLPFAIAFLIKAGEASYWGPLFPRLVACLFGGFLFLSIKNPVWSIPGFLIVLGPLQTFGITFRYQIGEYPLTLTSASIWLLGLFWFVRRPRQNRSVRCAFPARLTVMLWIGMIVGAIPALFALPADDAPFIVTPLVIITGLVEPFMLYLIVRSWLKVYGRPRLLIDSLMVSLMVALLTGIINFNLNKKLFTEGDLSVWRYHFMAFGGANLVGVILSLVYPMCFLPKEINGQSSFRQNPALAILIWLIAFVSYSRATPIILGLETLIMWVWISDKRPLSKIVVTLFGTVLCGLLISPGTMVDTLFERFTSTNLIDYFVGNTLQISESDSYRHETQKVVAAEILRRPFGGYAASGQADPESLILDIFLQLGWIPGMMFIVLEVAMIWAGFKSLREGYPNTIIKSFICMWIGFVIYTTLTGSNISKISVVDDFEYPIQINATSTLVIVSVLAIYNLFLDKLYFLKKPGME